MRYMPSRPFENVLLITQVIPAIRSDWIARFVNVGHGEGRRMPSIVHEVCRRIVVKPLNVLRTGMVCFVPKSVFGQESHSIG